MFDEIISLCPEVIVLNSPLTLGSSKTASDNHVKGVIEAV
jgi:hypothetical protein